MDAQQSQNLPLKVMTINRHYKPEVTVSIFDDEDHPFALTIERPWKNNQKDISCIPEGEYIPKRVKSPTYGDTFEIPVVGRTDVLFHWGAFATDSKGCIIVAESFQDMLNPKTGKIELGLQTSKIEAGKGFLEFLQRTKGLNEFKLVVRKCG